MDLFSVGCFIGCQIVCIFSLVFITSSEVCSSDSKEGPHIVFVAFLAMLGVFSVCSNDPGGTQVLQFGFTFIMVIFALAFSRPVRSGGRHRGKASARKKCATGSIANMSHSWPEKATVFEAATARENAPTLQTEQTVKIDLIGCKPVTREDEIAENVARINAFCSNESQSLTTSQQIMVGIALCRPDLIYEVQCPTQQIEQAWKRLDAGQREAIIIWSQEGREKALKD
jgi:hypothetical protein